MDFWQVLQERYSVRAFDPSIDVPPQTIDRLLEAAIRAPSAGNRQPWHFYVVRDAALRKGLELAAYGQAYISQAPVAIVVCAIPAESAERYGERGSQLYCLQDTAAAIEHILLAAVALDLGGCWIGAFNESEAARVLDLPGDRRPVAILPIGKPAGERTEPSPRKALRRVTSAIG